MNFNLEDIDGILRTIDCLEGAIRSLTIQLLLDEHGLSPSAYATICEIQRFDDIEDALGVNEFGRLSLSVADAESLIDA